MRRFSLVLCTVLAAGACVNLDKPEEVAKCSATDSCRNTPTPKDASSKDAQVSDGPRANDGIGDGQSSNDGGEALDSGTVLPVLDGGLQPDMNVLPLDAEVPDQPDSAADAAADVAIVTPDAGQAGRDGPRDVAPGICAMNGALKPAGTLCRPAVGPCDLAETCDGVSADCPADKLAAAGKECRPAAAGCDIAETCDGTNVDCPVDRFTQAGTVCREAAGPCDYAEICPGDSADCPSDSLKPSSLVCRATTNACDPPESCSGLGTDCPLDIPPYPQPTAPTTVTATPGELQATVTWSAVSGATAYNVKRSTTPNGPYTTIATAVSTTTYVDKGLDSNNTYYYVVSSINSILSCVSLADSPEASAKPTGICVKPETPQVTAVAGNGQVTLSWEAISGATAYAVDRSETSTSGYALYALVPTPTTTFVDNAVEVGQTYYYRVTAKAVCDSDPSPEVSAVPVCEPAATAPTSLVASTPNTGGVVVLTWAPVAGARSADRYYILRKLSSATTFTKIDEVAPPTTTYNDTTAANGTAYTYVVTYFNGTCTSANSNMVNATAACVMNQPVLTLKPGNKQVDLSWTAPANGSLSGFRVYRKDTGSYALVTSLTGAGSTSYSDTGLTNGTTYTYYVTAVGNCNADSEPKSTIPVCTPLPAPTNLQASAGDHEVNLSWVAVADADHYTVSRGDASGGPYTALVPVSPITTNSYKDTGLTNGQTYYYVVSVSNGSCDSTSSNEAYSTPSICSQNGIPGLPRLSLTSSSQVRIEWDAAVPDPPNGYNISRSTDDTTYISVDDVPLAAPTSYTDSSNITVDTIYYYKVTAKNATCGTPSAAASITLTCQNPAQPTGVSATNDPSNGQITVDWDPKPDATAYVVYRDDGAGGALSPISTDPAKPFVDSDVASGKTYNYQLIATNAHGQCTAAAPSDPVSAVACRQPSIPSGLTATVGPAAGSGKVALRWTASSNADSYELLRGATGGPYNTSVYTGPATSYTEESLTNDTTYYYVVKARNGGAACAATSAQIQATPRQCQVFLGSQIEITFNTTAAYCFVTCADLAAPGKWQGDNLDGRTVRVNGTTHSSGDALGTSRNGAYTFDVTAGTYSWAHINWWGTPHDCAP